MNHNLKISVSKQAPKDGVVSCKKVTLREKIMRKLFGETEKVTIIIPGDSVRDVTIREIEPQNGGVTNGN